MTLPLLDESRPDEAFRHEAMLYAGEGDFVAGAGSFIREGLAADEAVLVVVSAAKIAALRDELGCDADGVEFADMRDVGLNPARIIPAWQAFVDARPKGVRPRGIGEPIWADRSPAELVECQGHENLLNTAFGGGVAWSLLCPYDTEALDPTVIREARASHPFVRGAHGSAPSDTYRGAATGAPSDQPLPEPPVTSLELGFGLSTLGSARDLVARFLTTAGVRGTRATDFITVVNELTTNSVRHADGCGFLRLWEDEDTLVCEVRDGGRFQGSLLAGRERPATDRLNGRGLWLANHLCDLVQIRSLPTGTVVRAHLHRR